MDAETAFSADAIVFPLLIAAFIYFVVIRPLYRRDRDRRGRKDKRRE
jgi:preprotein translocase subunit YajC